MPRCFRRGSRVSRVVPPASFVVELPGEAQGTPAGFPAPPIRGRRDLCLVAQWQGFACRSRVMILTPLLVRVPGLGHGRRLLPRGFHTSVRDFALV